ncbi:hypothetical protein EEB14_37540 [Rhodococcus sp. WS4]|nr:hypothetical protein EEB14_37540 [Rhodococcus sp. WS4]
MNAHRRAVVSIGIPAAVFVVGLVVPLFWITELPSTVAAQWNSSGVSSTTPVWSIFVYLIAAGVLIVGFTGLTTAKAHSSVSRRTCAGVGIGMSVFISVAAIGLTHSQRGLSAPAEATGPPAGWIAAAAAAAVLGGIAGAIAVENDRATGTTPDERSDRKDVGAAPSGAYVRTVTNWYLVTAVLATGIALLALSVAVSSVVPAIAGAFVLATAPLGVWRVIVGPDGIRAFSLIRVPSVAIPISSVRSVHRRTVNPFRDFGGYGLRSTGRGTTGVIVAAGDAIDVTTRDGESTVITVSRADEVVDTIRTLRAGT